MRQTKESKLLGFSFSDFLPLSLSLSLSPYLSSVSPSVRPESQKRAASAARIAGQPKEGRRRKPAAEEEEGRSGSDAELRR